ncbi:elongin-B isoform X2 [Thamnophis elegans]|uniref:elongin-B isoform X2 n=1 Tax=Thamnophis elegans TaxID=35005 RepID=UPI00137669A0|nr:elongin-B isoform X2 [Thamnophis elegans]
MRRMRHGVLPLSPPPPHTGLGYIPTAVHVGKPGVLLLFPLWGVWAEAASAEMDVFLMIRRHKATIFTDAKESSTVYELKRIVEGILKRPPEEQRLYKDDQLLEDSKTLGDCGFTSQTARPQAPATVGLAFRASDVFENLRIDPFSSPPELPDVMKPQDSGSSANEQAVQ